MSLGIDVENTARRLVSYFRIDPNKALGVANQLNGLEQPLLLGLDGWPFISTGAEITLAKKIQTEQLVAQGFSDCTISVLDILTGQSQRKTKRILSEDIYQALFSPPEFPMLTN